MKAISCAIMVLAAAVFPHWETNDTGNVICALWTMATIYFLVFE